MTRQEFLSSMDELLELSSGTLQGPEKLEELEQWNSMAMIGFIALADTNNGAKLSARQITSCTTIADLLDLAKVDASPV
jgi:acyl carrier protein